MLFVCIRLLPYLPLVQVHSRPADLNSHDWLQMVQSGGAYLLADMWPHNRPLQEAVQGLRTACNLLLHHNSVAGEEERAGDTVSELKYTLVVALCKIEAVIPATDLAVIMHILLHVPDCIYRWNNVRNWWCFFGERCMGGYIRFINNRDLACENIMTACVRQLFILNAPHGALANAFKKARAMNLPLPQHSALIIASERKATHKSLPGEYNLQVTKTRRNSRKIQTLSPLVKAAIRTIAQRNPARNYKLASGEKATFLALTGGCSHILCSCSFPYN